MGEAETCTHTVRSGGRLTPGADVPHGVVALFGAGQKHAVEEKLGACCRAAALMWKP